MRNYTVKWFDGLWNVTTVAVSEDKLADFIVKCQENNGHVNSVELESN